LSVDFKKVVELILKHKPDIDREQIREMNDEKTRNRYEALIRRSSR